MLCLSHLKIPVSRKINCRRGIKINHLSQNLLSTHLEAGACLNHFRLQTHAYILQIQIMCETWSGAVGYIIYIIYIILYIYIDWTHVNNQMQGMVFWDSGTCLPTKNGPLDQGDGKPPSTTEHCATSVGRKLPTRRSLGMTNLHQTALIVENLPATYLFDWWVLFVMYRPYPDDQHRPTCRRSRHFLAMWGYVV